MHFIPGRVERMEGKSWKEDPVSRQGDRVVVRRGPDGKEHVFRILGSEKSPFADNQTPSSQKMSIEEVIIDLDQREAGRRKDGY